MSNAAKLDELDAKIKELQAERRRLATEVGIPLVKEALAEIFTFPGITNVYWTQGTPSWCDGDPCTFSVNDSYFNYDESDDASQYGDDQDQAIGAYHPQWAFESSSYRDAIDLGWEPEQVEEFCRLARGFYDWTQAHKDFLADAFGDPVSVIIRADGTHEIGEYYID